MRLRRETRKTTRRQASGLPWPSSSSPRSSRLLVASRSGATFASLGRAWALAAGMHVSSARCLCADARGHCFRRARLRRLRWPAYVAVGSCGFALWNGVRRHPIWDLVGAVVCIVSASIHRAGTPLNSPGLETSAAAPPPTPSRGAACRPPSRHRRRCQRPRRPHCRHRGRGSPSWP